MTQPESRSVPRSGPAVTGAPAAARGHDTARPRATSRLAAWGPVAAVVVLVLPALWPLFRSGFFVSDDGLFHVYRIAALANAWRQGVLYPRLFPDFGFGYGQAVLNFYAPLTYVPGAALSLLGIDPATAAKLTIALGFLLAGLAMFGYVRSLWGPLAGILAALAYTYFPYHLADAYLRGAIPEHFAFVWPPLILWAYTTAFRREKGTAGPLLAGSLFWAALVYTHNLTALILAPVCALYLLVLAVWTRRWRRLWAAAGSLLLAVLLSAPLLVPFVAESGSVGLGADVSAGYQKHLAPLARAVQWLPLYRYRLEQGGAADHPLAWPALAIFVAVALLAAWALWRRRSALRGWPVLAFGLLLAAGAALMITQATLPVWVALQPVLARLQYPWRFLALAGLGMGLVAGALPALLAPLSARWRTGAVLLAGIVLLVTPLVYVPAKPLPLSAADAWSPLRMWQEDAANGQVGATWTGEFLPQTVREQRWALGRPPANPQNSPAPAARPTVRLDRVGYQQAQLTVDTVSAFNLRLHQFFLPGWIATLDGRPAAAGATGELGLVTTNVPAGSHQITLAFGPTPARNLGALAGGLAALIWIVWAWRAWSTATTPRPRWLLWAACGLAVLALALGLNRFGVGQRTWAPRPVNAALGDVAAGDVAVGDVALLLGYDTAPARGQNALDVTLYWFALRDTATDYKAFVHLVDAGGQVVAQQDGDPGQGFTPTTRWRPGELIADTHRVPLDNVPAGPLTLKVGLYDFGPPARNLAVDPPTADNRVDLGTVNVAGK